MGSLRSVNRDSDFNVIMHAALINMYISFHSAQNHFGKDEIRGTDADDGGPMHSGWSSPVMCCTQRSTLATLIYELHDNKNVSFCQWLFFYRGVSYGI